MTSLYIHIPFCRSKCLFCSFVIAVGKTHHIDSYLDALAWEARQYKGQGIKTIYIGGGTPSFMDKEQLQKLIFIVKENFRFDKNAEFTIEANPEDVTEERAEILSKLGINRLSLGVQSLNNKFLKFLGRSHDSDAALKAFSILREVGFTNINLDLMFAFPDQSMEELEKDVCGIVELGSEHLSLYTLTIEEGSRFFKQNIHLDDDSIQAKQYHRVVELLEKSGFYQYEISNFAKPNRESRHNSMYWQGGDYIGLGVGAHSHLEGRRFWNVPKFNLYLTRIKENLSPMEGEERLTPQERFMEALLFGLRMTKGINISQLEKRFSYPLPKEKKEMIHQLVANSFLSFQEGRLQTTSQGRLVLDEICTKLI